jgi:molecular chaperone GrpE (heat shock protein)
LAKWPFYLADLALSAVLVFVLHRLGPIEGTTDVVIAVACVFGAAWAAWLSLIPWLNEHRAVVDLSESANLKSSLEQIKSVEKVAELIRQANLQWQSVQDSAGRTVTAAQEISDKMKSETEEFMRFLDNAQNSERAGLRLEVEKLRRMEGDWIKVTVGILDHVFAITRAAERSGQQQVASQLQQFQTACREVARRIGLAPFAPMLGETFDDRAHQLPDPKATPPAEARIGEVLATGFTYQGQLLRRSLVMIEGWDPHRPPAPATPQGAARDAAAPEAEAATPDSPRATDEAVTEIMTQPGPSADPQHLQASAGEEGTLEPGGEPPAEMSEPLQEAAPVESAGKPGAVAQNAPPNPDTAEVPAGWETDQPMPKPSRRKRPAGQDELPLV